MRNNLDCFANISLKTSVCSLLDLQVELFSRHLLPGIVVAVQCLKDETHAMHITKLSSLFWLCCCHVKIWLIPIPNKIIEFELQPFRDIDGWPRSGSIPGVVLSTSNNGLYFRDKIRYSPIIGVVWHIHAVAIAISFLFCESKFWLCGFVLYHKSFFVLWV